MSYLNRTVSISELKYDQACRVFIPLSGNDNKKARKKILRPRTKLKKEECFEVSLIENPSPPLGHVINCISLSVRYAVCHQWIYPIYQSVITRGVMYLRREVHR